MADLSQTNTSGNTGSTYTLSGNTNAAGSISSDALNNTPVSTSPSASDVSNTSSFNVPPPNSSGDSSAQTIMGTTQALNDSQTNLESQAQSNVDTAQTNYDTTGNSITGLIGQYLGKGQDQLNLEAQANIPGLRTMANNLTTQYQTKQLAYNNQYNAIFSNPKITAEQAAQQISDLNQSHSYDLANTGILQAIAQNQYQTAQTLVDHQIDVKYSPLKDAITFGMQFLQNNKDLLTQAQTNKLTTNLQVQQQQYENGTYYAHLNNDASLQMIKDASANGASPAVIQSMTTLMSKGASAGAIAGAAGAYLIKGNYPITYNPKTQQMEPYNQNTGLFRSDGSPIPSNSTSYNLTDPNSTKMVTAPDGTQYDFSSYAKDPQYSMKVQAKIETIKNTVGAITSPQLMQSAISTFDPTSKLVGADVYNTAVKNGIDPTVFAAQLQEESNFGTSNVAIADNNYCGMTYTGSASQKAAGITQGTARPALEGGFYAKFATPQAGLNYEAKFSAGKKVQPPANTPGQTPTIQSKIQTISSIKQALPSNIGEAVNYVNSTGNGYIDLSKVQDLPGMPAGIAKTQALAYAKQFGLAPLNSDQVLAVQDYDTAMQKVNVLQSQWNKVGPSVLSTGIRRFTDPVSESLDTQRGKDLIQYKSNAGTALSTFNTIVDSKRLSQFSDKLSEGALPQTPHFANYGLIGSQGDTLEDGNLKFDNMRTNLNASLKSIDSSFTGAPLSTDLPSTANSTMKVKLSSGQTGTIDPKEFDPKKMTKL